MINIVKTAANVRVEYPLTRVFLTHCRIWLLLRPSCSALV
jgi:hypothetical protein